jgi:ferredoxin-NADP reductase
MGKNLARLEMQVFLEEFTRRLPHMRLAEQRFSYVPNTSFRGPEHLWVEWDPALNPERRDPGVLAPRTAVKVGESSGHAITRPVVVERAERAAEGVLHLVLRAPDGKPFPRWAPGSHIDVECGDSGLSRQYSLCGDPEDTQHLHIGVLLESEGRGGSAWMHEHATPGARLRIRGPRNHFRFDESAPKAVFVAGGIGITPVMAMARRAKALGKDYVLHYCGRSRRTMAFVAELQALHGGRLQLHAADEGRRLDVAALFATPQPGTQVYACGPERLLDALQAATAHWPEDTLRVEHFHAAPSLLDPAKEHAFEVELKDSGIVVPVRADETVLAALRAANIDVQSDCEEGLCGTCEVRVLSGEVDHRDVVLTRAERQANDRMMSCCSRACGQRIVLDL